MRRQIDLQLRITRNLRNGNTFLYAYLVESYRRKPDGMSTHRIVKSYGWVTELEAENLKATLNASNAGKKVVAEGTANLPARVRPHRHRNDDKVRAHVTLCVLPLAVERQIEAMLRKADTPMTAQRALGTLRPALLKVLEMPDDKHQLLTVTKVPESVDGIGQAIPIAWALDDESLAAKLHTVTR